MQTVMETLSEVSVRLANQSSSSRVGEVIGTYFQMERNAQREKSEEIVKHKEKDEQFLELRGSFETSMEHDEAELDEVAMPLHRRDLREAVGVSVPDREGL